MKKINKIISVTMLILLLLGIFFSYDYIISHKDHDCLGKSCSVCMQIEEAVRFVSTLKYTPILSLAMTVLCIFIGRNASFIKCIILKSTLVALKVELLN